MKTLLRCALAVVMVAANIGFSQTDIWREYTPTSPSHIATNSAGHIFVGYQGHYTLTSESPGAGVFRSTDNGDSWQVLNSGLTSTNIVGLHCTRNGTLFAGTHLDRVFRSTNNGSTWAQVPVTARLAYFTSRGDTVFGSDGFWCRGVFRSTDNGATWTQMNSGLDPCANGLTISAAGNVFAATGTSGVYRSTNWGISWSAVNSGVTNSNCVTVVSNAAGNIFLGTVGGGIFRSTNQGIIWTQVNSGLTRLQVSSLGVNSAGQIFAGVYPSAGLFRSTNNGDSWAPINAGFYDTLLSVGDIMATPSGYLWVSVTGLIYRSIQPLVSVRSDPNSLPSSFWLGQNYPNPFNPTTNFEYAVTGRGHVKVEVFNNLGQVIATLVDGMMESGNYHVSWNGKSSNGGAVSSGTYFYRLSTDGVVQMKKMIMIK